MVDQHMTVDDHYAIAQAKVQKAIYDYAEALERDPNVENGQQTGAYMIAFLGGMVGSIFHELFTPESKEDFLITLLERANIVVETLNGENPTIEVTKHH